MRFLLWLKWDSDTRKCFNSCNILVWTVGSSMAISPCKSFWRNKTRHRCGSEEISWKFVWRCATSLSSWQRLIDNSTVTTDELRGMIICFMRCFFTSMFLKWMFSSDYNWTYNEGKLLSYHVFPICWTCWYSYQIGLQKLYIFRTTK